LSISEPIIAGTEHDEQRWGYECYGLIQMACCGCAGVCLCPAVRINLGLKLLLPETEAIDLYT
jgi:hypothetical protein